MKPGDTVFAVPFGYYNLFDLLRMHGVRIIGVPRLVDGPDLEQLQALFMRLERHMGAALVALDKSGWEVFTPPTGGMFVWAKPPTESSEALEERARECGVVLSPGRLFLPEPTETPWRRLNVAYMQDESVLKFIRAFQ